MEIETRLPGAPPKMISLVFLCVFATLGSVIITPSLPEISHYFSVSDGQAQLTVTSFMLGYALGQLVYGPIANRSGRVLTLHIGLVFAILGTIFSILSSPFESFSLLIVGRFVEAIGCSVGVVVSFMMVNDYYYPPQAKKIFAIFMAALAIFPACGVLLGGILNQYIDWQSCFYFLFIYNIVLFGFSFLLKETLQVKDKHALRIKNIVVNYSRAALNRNILVFSLLVGCSVSFVYVFAAEAPFIVIKSLGFSPATYGFLAMIPCVGVLLGSLWMMRYHALFSNKQLIIFALLLDVFSVLCLLLLFVFHVVNLYSLLIPVFMIYFSHAFIAANTIGLITANFNDKSNGTSVSNFLMMGVTVLATFAVSLIHSVNPIVLPLVYLVLVVLIALFFLFCKEKYKE